MIGTPGGRAARLAGEGLRTRPSRSSPTAPTPTRSRACSSTSSCATARPARSSSARPTRSRSTRCSRRPRAANVRVIAGKTLMDRNAPAALLDTPQSGYDESKALLRALARQGPRALRDHAALRADEHATRSSRRRARSSASTRTRGCTRTSRRTRARSRGCTSSSPSAPDYLDVYGHHGLLGERTMLAHGVHLIEARLRALRRDRHGARALPDVEPVPRQRAARPRRARSTPACASGWAPDVGAGTSFSLLRTLDEACKVAQLRGAPLDPLERVLARDARRRARARARGPDRLARARARGRPRRARPARDAAARAAHGRARTRSRTCCSR